VNSTSVRRIALPGIAALVLGLSLSACGAGNESSSDDSSSGGGSLSGTLNGAGSSAQQAAQAAWTADFQKANSGVTINYNPIGSGGGVTQFNSGGVDFAGSDKALDASAGEIDAANKRCGADAIEVPDYISPIAIVFNVPGVKSLNLDPDTAAKMFAGKITKWNDPEIKGENPGAKLPDLAIAPVHRSDPSGTTNNFTDYLSKAAKDVWTWPAAEDWPIKSGEGASGTSGMVDAVTKGKGALAYIDNSQVGNLSVASIKVGSKYVAPSADGASKALSVSKPQTGRPASDIAIDIDRTTTADGAYPIALTSYLIACPTYSGDKADLVKQYLSYVVSTEGQQSAATAAGSAPLPDNLQQQAAQLIDGITKS